MPEPATSPLPPLSVLLDEPLASVHDREAHTLERLLATHANRVVIFGCGGLGRSAIAKLRELGVTPLALCDNNQSLWGTTIDGIPVLSVPQASTSFGPDALFVVAVWNPHHWFGEASNTLKAHGARTVVPYLPMYWRFPTGFLPVYLLNDLPHHVYEAKADVLAAESLWADTLSLQIYRANIHYRALGDPSFMPPRPAENTYFPPDIFTCAPHERIIDCGAFDGDTIKLVLSRCATNLDAIYSLEGDPVSFARLEAFVASLTPETQTKIHLIQGAVGRERSIVRFTSDGGTGSHMGSEAGIDVECYPLDHLNLAGPVTMIKMDIEGAEYDALIGGRGVILRDKPILAVCVYHIQHDLWRLPLLAHELLPDHKLYLRAYEGDGFQTVLYAVPPSRALAGSA